jgi:DNA helicase-2/ATP-dependent DNA helicase PcrA
MPLDLGRLNSRQREAVLHGDGPLLVLAGAGSGKTSTMAYRIAHLVAERRVPATAILGLSFTNKAAKELKERVSKLIAQHVPKTSGASAAKGLTISTFHSLCVRFLREHAAAIGYRKDFTILDQSDQRDVLRQCLKNIKIDERRFDPDLILFEIGQAKNRFLSPEKAEGFFLDSGRLGADYGIAAQSSYGRYQEQLRVLNAMDFDDLLFNAVRLLETHAPAREQYNTRFRYLLVDEYQDTNPSQFRLLRLLTEKRQNLCVVGDDDQSIYAWRGADPAHILEFARQFRGARTITLDQNYRSTATILDAANGVISGNRHRHPKKLWSDRGQGEVLTEIALEDDHHESDFVAEELLRLHQAPRAWRDFAVLYRSNAQSRVFEEAFRRNRVPYKIVGGYSFLDRKEVKDTLSYWRLLSNPSDDASLRRVINWPSRGIGKTSLEALGTRAFESGTSLFEALTHATVVAPRAVAGAAALRETVLRLRESLAALPGDPAQVSEWARGTVAAFQIHRAIEEETKDEPNGPLQAQTRRENVDELVHSIGQLKLDEPVADGTAVLHEFLARMTLDSQDREDEDDKDQDAVTLLTLHGAKGLEFPVVFLVGLEDGFLPHKRTLEEGADISEERRLCYVGITRAKDLLFITRAKNRIRYGKPVPRYPSRFLAEIPAGLIVKRDLSSNPEHTDAKAKEQHETRVKSFLEQMRGALGGG